MLMENTSEGRVPLVKSGRILTRLSLILGVFVLVRIWGVVGLIVHQGMHDRPDFWIRSSAIVYSLQGFLNALVYGTTKHVIREYSDCLCCHHRRWKGGHLVEEPATLTD